MHMSHKHVKSYLGQHVHCHTPYGTFEGVIVQCTKHHVILAPMQPYTESSMRVMPMRDEGEQDRPFPMGPGGPVGPGPGPGPGWGGGGGGWSFAIPLAAILGVTAIGMHWW